TKERRSSSHLSSLDNSPDGASELGGLRWSGPHNVHLGTRMASWKTPRDKSESSARFYCRAKIRHCRSRALCNSLVQRGFFQYQSILDTNTRCNGDSQYNSLPDLLPLRRQIRSRQRRLSRHKNRTRTHIYHGQVYSQRTTHMDQDSRLRFRASRNHYNLHTLSQHPSPQQTARRDPCLRRRNRIRSLHRPTEKIPLEEPRRQ